VDREPLEAVPISGFTHSTGSATLFTVCAFTQQVASIRAEKRIVFMLRSSGILACIKSVKIAFRMKKYALFYKRPKCHISASGKAKLF
jgi:hypothetical protein